MMKPFLNDNMSDGRFRDFNQIFKVTPYPFGIKAQFFCCFDQSKYIGSFFVSPSILSDTRNGEFKFIMYGNRSKTSRAAVCNIVLFNCLLYHNYGFWVTGFALLGFNQSSTLSYNNW